MSLDEEIQQLRSKLVQTDERLKTLKEELENKPKGFWDRVEGLASIIASLIVVTGE